MNKKTSFIVLAIVAFFIVGLVVILQQVGQKGAPAGQESESASTSVSREGLVQTQEEVDQIVRQAIDNQDVSLCENIAKEDGRKSCKEYAITATASVNGDPTICNQLTEEGQKISCKDYLIINQAIAAQNPGLCEEMINKARIDECKGVVSSPR